MQTLTRRHMVVIEDYDHMKTMDKNVKWMKLTHLLSKMIPNLRAPSCASTFTARDLICFLNVHSREKLFLSLMYTKTSNYTPSYTHINSYMVWRIHPHNKLTLKVLPLSMFLTKKIRDASCISLLLHELIYPLWSILWQSIPKKHRHNTTQPSKGLYYVSRLLISAWFIPLVLFLIGSKFFVALISEVMLILALSLRLCLPLG